MGVFATIYMRDKKRIKRILEKLIILWESQQDLRFFQMLINNEVIYDDPFLWGKEDDSLEEDLDILLKNVKNGKRDN
jgi:hypothetical protein